MHFIESLFGIAPDAGSGSLELSLIFVVAAVGISVLWLKARRRSVVLSHKRLILSLIK
jgi:hypothetical protein